jgi:hypothetical protein
VLRELLRDDPERDRQYGEHGDGDTANKEDENVVGAYASMRNDGFIRKWEGTYHSGRST